MDALLLYRWEKKGFFADIYYFADVTGQRLSGVEWQGISMYSWVGNWIKIIFKREKPNQTQNPHNHLHSLPFFPLFVSFSTVFLSSNSISSNLGKEVVDRVCHPKS